MREATRRERKDRWLQITQRLGVQQRSHPSESGPTRGRNGRWRDLVTADDERAEGRQSRKMSRTEQRL